MNNEIKVYVVDYGRPSLYMRYKDPVTNKQVTRSTGTKKKKEAEKVAAKWEAALQEGRYQTPSKITWAEFRIRYEDEVLVAKAKKTEQKVCSTFNAVERILNPEKLASVTSERISYLQSELRKTNVSEATVRSHSVHLKAALRWAARKKILVEVPDIDIPSASGMKGRPITVEEFERMLEKVPEVVGEDAADDWVFILKGLWWSGLRLGEALELHWTDDRLICVDFAGKRPMFRIRAEAQKSGQDSILPMAPEFSEFLQATAIESREGHVFNPRSQKSNATRLRLDTTSKVISKIGEAANIKVAENANGKVKFASAHDLRRAFGERWSTRIMPPVLQQLMRHESITTTMKYYVGRNAESAADVLWDAVSGNTSSNYSPSEQSDGAENPVIYGK